MDTSAVILHIAIILIVARIFGEFATYISAPSVIGELVAGVLLGPTLLDLIEPDGMIHILAEVGVILLLFQIGLETNIHNLVQAGKNSVLVAVGGFILPFVLCYFVSYFWFKLEILVSVMIAGTMTATSIGITMRSLTKSWKRCK